AISGRITLWLLAKVVAISGRITLWLLAKIIDLLKKKSKENDMRLIVAIGRRFQFRSALASL
ncbi:hypothetical protein QQP08_000543, partial [Theobroma cacao]